MPADYRLRFRDNENGSPARPDTTKAYPKQPVQRIQPRTRLFSFEDGELLPQGKDLDGVVSASAEERSHGGQGNQDEVKHGILRSTTSGSFRSPWRKSLILRGDRLLSTYTYDVALY